MSTRKVKSANNVKVKKSVIVDENRCPITLKTLDEMIDKGKTVWRIKDKNGNVQQIYDACALNKWISTKEAPTYPHNRVAISKKDIAKIQKFCSVKEKSKDYIIFELGVEGSEYAVDVYSSEKDLRKHIKNYYKDEDIDDDIPLDDLIKWAKEMGEYNNSHNKWGIREIFIN
jgi:hypothetical protein